MWLWTCNILLALIDINQYYWYWGCDKAESFSRCWSLKTVIPATKEAEIRRIAIRSQPGQIVHETLSWNHWLKKRTGEVTQVIKYMSTKHEALNSNQYCTKKKRKLHCFWQKDLLEQTWEDYLILFNKIWYCISLTRQFHFYESIKKIRIF
jgi:hypothetical protein